MQAAPCAIVKEKLYARDIYCRDRAFLRSSSSLYISYSTRLIQTGPMGVDTIQRSVSSFGAVGRSVFTLSFVSFIAVFPYSWASASRSCRARTASR